MVHRWCRRACGGATARARGRGGVDGGLRPGGGGAGAAQRGAGRVSDAGDGVRGGAGDGVCGSDARGRVRERSATCPDRRVSSKRAGVSEHDPPIAKKRDPHKAPRPCRPLRIRRRRPLPTSVALQCRRLQQASLTGGREDRDLDTGTQAQPIAFVLQIVTRWQVEPELRGGAEVSTESHSNARRNRRRPPSSPRLAIPASRASGPHTFHIARDFPIVRTESARARAGDVVCAKQHLFDGRYGCRSCQWWLGRPVCCRGLAHPLAEVQHIARACPIPTGYGVQLRDAFRAVTDTSCSLVLRRERADVAR